MSPRIDPGFATGYIPEPLPPAAVARHKTTDLAAVRAAGDTTRVRKLWRHGALLNQRQLPACAGFAFAAELIAAPYADDADTGRGNAYAKNHYRRACYLYYGANAYPDRVDKNGVSIRAVAQVALDRGLIEGFAWARTAAEIRDAVVTTGPVVIGVPWLGSMTGTRADGLIRVRFPADFDMADTSGHALAITGYHPDAPVTVKGRKGPHRAFRIRNSWGTMWGADDRKNWRLCTGTGWLLVEDLERLLDVYYPRAGGEWMDTACLPIGRRPVDIDALLAAHPDPTIS